MNSRNWIRHGVSRWWRGVSLATLLTVTAAWLYAHEGHVALPSRGAQVDAVKGIIVLSRESRDALDVQSAEITTRPIPESVLAYATLVAPWQKHAFASSRLPGRIVKLHAKPGDSVTSGQIVAEVISFELDNLHREILAAQAEMRLADRTAALMRESAGTVPQQSILDADTKRLQAAHSLAVSRAKWLGLGLDVSDFDNILRDPTHRLATYPVRSPISGSVIHADLSVGQVIATGEHLFEVVDLTTVWAKIGVLEKDMSRIQVGQAVELKLSAHSGEVFSGSVQAVNSSLDPQTHLNNAWMELTNPYDRDPRFLPGMTGQARIQMAMASDARVIPTNALIDDGLAQYVLVEEAKADKQSEYRRKNVVVVRPTVDRVEVLAPDLFPGDRVVTQGAHELGSFFVPGVLKLSTEASRTIGLEVGVVGRQLIADVIEVEGQVDVLPSRRSVASTHLAGNIVRILVDRGQSVVAGQVMAEIDSLDAMNLQLDLLREQLALNLLDQQTQAFRKAGDAVPQRKLLDLEAERNAVMFRRDAARSRLSVIGLTHEEIDAIVVARRPYDRIPIRAAIGGTVASFDKVLGQAVKAEEGMFTVLDLSRPSVQGFVSERDAGRVRVGQAARIRLVGDHANVLEGRVFRSSRVVTTDDQTYRIWIEVERPTNAVWRDGQLASISILASASAAVVSVPNAAVLRDGTKAYVFLRQSDGEFVRRLVTTGRCDDRYTEILNGVAEADTIAFRGVNGLQKAYAAIR